MTYIVEDFDREENMDLTLIFEDWGIKNSAFAMMCIYHNHKEDKTSLQLLDRMLHKIYKTSEVKDVLLRYVPKLDASMLEYMIKTKNGASDILKLMEEVCNA